MKSWPDACIQGVDNPEDTMQRQQPRGGQERLNRIQLIGRVQFAYEQLKETMQRYHDDSPRARAAIASARRRLTLLNRTLAMLALQVAQEVPA
jgi:hypothetical protein